MMKNLYMGLQILPEQPWNFFVESEDTMGLQVCVLGS